MFSNFVNIEDFKRVIWGIRHGYARKIISRLTKGRLGRVKDQWKSKKKAVPSTWWQCEQINKRWNYLVTGSEEVTFYQYLAQKYFSQSTGLKVLSLGCGTGSRELKWLEFCDFALIDAVDISDQSIAYAREQAKTNGYDQIINYQVGDLNTMELKESYYDLIYVDMSLHHFTPLEHILKRIIKAMKPSGYFIVNEFVGATRWQWPDRQLEVANGLLALLPEKYRKHRVDGNTKRKSIRQSRLSMIMKDPSESVESANIMPLLKKMFNIVEFRSYRGGVLHLLFDGIIHHFMSGDKEAEKYLKLCFAVEDLLTETGEINDDFVIVVCSAKDSITAKSS